MSAPVMPAAMRSFANAAPELVALAYELYELFDGDEQSVRREIDELRTQIKRSRSAIENALKRKYVHLTPVSE